jgi:hypothetical protein
MTLESTLKQVAYGEAACYIFVYGFSMLTQGTSQFGIFFENLIDEELINDDVKNVMQKIKFDEFGKLFSSCKMKNDEIVEAAYFLAAKHYFGNSEGFVPAQAALWSKTYSTKQAYKSFGRGFFVAMQGKTLSKRVVANSRYTHTMTAFYLSKHNFDAKKVVSA